MARQEDEIARLLVPLPRFVEPVLGQFQSCRTVELLPDSGAQRREIHRSSRSQSPRARSRGVGQRVPFPLRDVAAWLVENRLRSGTPDRQGRIYYKFHGVYGRCWYPTKKQPSIRLSCQVPGPFPCEIITRKKPIYRNSDGTWPAEAKQHRGPVYCDASSGRQWKRVYAKTTVRNLNEGVVWVFAHEAFHWLRKTGQIPGRNNEIEADAFADQMLGKFRAIESRAKDQLFQPTTPRQPKPVQCELFGEP